MKLTDIAKKPTLIEVSIDDEETVAQFGEPVTFFMWDRLPISVFLKMAAIDESNLASVVEVVKDVVLDEKGKPVITGDTTMPPSLLMKIITVAVNDLGN